ncbi:general odorant-binding protein 56a-like [Episyrphus balteatus]|uniref:general odorant-binding protein 56a-like n=1 Tax=Episyrphus balteatus TaxID=286459 RepID=UPI0024851281|nr:general odorant-binding protein 56a-like [Episyrphus balteatus]
MKFIIFISFAVAIFNTVNAWSSENSSKYIDECRVELKISDDVNQYNLTTGEIPEADIHPDMKCFLNCFMEKLGILRDGIIQEDSDGFNHYVGAETAKEMIESCRDESGTSNCDTAFKLHRCFLKHLSYEFYRFLLMQNGGDDELIQKLLMAVV